MKRKVMILANDTTYTYNLRNEIIERLIAEQYEVTIAAELLFFQDELKDMGCRLYNICTNRHSKNPFGNILLFFQYLSILRKEKPDYILTYNIKPNVYAGFACRFVKTHFFPNVTGLGTPLEQKGMLQMIAVFLCKLGFAKADCVFFQNRDNLKFFEDKKILKKQCTWQ